jgi:signal transduction histidine kinase
VGGAIGLGLIAELGARTVQTSADAIAAVAGLVERTTGVDLTVVSEVTTDGRYVFRAARKPQGASAVEGSAIPYAWSLCSRIHAGESPPTVPDTREVPALWRAWLRLKEGIGVDWDILAFCTREVRLPDGALFGTVCLHHNEPRVFSADEEALLEVLARLLGDEIWRERAAVQLGEALASLDAAERARVELAEELRHELRAPLQVIDGYAEAMLDGLLERDDEHVTLVRSEAGRAMRLLDDLATLARLEANLGPSETGQADAYETVAEMRERLAPLVETGGVELVAEAVPTAVPMPPKRLEQLLINLVRNALRAVQQGGGTRITMFVRREDGIVSVGVEDDGPGVPPHALPRVFDRFYRGDSGGEPGSGLGLTIARRIATAAGGEIAAEPVAPRGLRVVARIPVEEGAAGGGESAVEP